MLFQGKPKYGNSKKDLEAVARYQQWCKSLGIEPAPQSIYLQTTAQHNPQPIAWSSVK